MFGRNGRYCAALGGLILALAVGGHGYAGSGQQQGAADKGASDRGQAQAAKPPAAPIYHANCHAPANREDANYCEQRKAAEAAQDQAVWAFVQTIIGGLGVFFVVLTLLYTARAANAAKNAAEAIPVLERAYVYSIIEAENIADAIEVAKQPPNRSDGYGNLVFLTTADAFPVVKLKFQNFGKTPARLINGEVHLSLRPLKDGTADVTDWPIKYANVLAEGDKTEEVERRFHRDITAAEAQKIESGEISVTVWGWMTYIDIWDRAHPCKVFWRYNPTLKRLTPQDVHMAAHEDRIERDKQKNSWPHWGPLRSGASGAIRTVYTFIDRHIQGRP